MSNNSYKTEYSSESQYCYISENARSELIEYITSIGYKINVIKAAPKLPQGINSHADLQVCRMGINSGNNTDVFIINPDRLGSAYPDYVLYNAACTGKFLICNEKYTAPEILDFAHANSIEIVNVKQGYAKCSCVIVDENSIITYDAGIAKECCKQDMDVLLISPGHVELEGYNTGFIGGASGRIGEYVIFNGNLEAHPDIDDIVGFIEKRGLKCKWFQNWSLTDIGSIV